MRGTRVMMAAAMCLFLAPEGLQAEGLEERVSVLEKKVEDGAQNAFEALGLEFHAMVSTQYMYSFNNPDSDEVEARTFDTNHNNIDLNQASLFLSRADKDASVGFGLTLDFGEVAEGVGAVSCWNRSCDSSEQDNAFELREAYLTYELPVGPGITFKAGRFVTLLGYEVIKSYDAFNENISRSIMFGYFLPFTHTGLLASAPIGDHVTVDLGVVNGWDDVVDRNDGKTLLAGLGVTPLENLSMYVAGTYGPEQTDRGGSKLGMVTLNTVYQPLENLTLALDLNYANESDVVDGRDQPCTKCRDADWYGGAAYATVQMTERTAFNLRVEVMDDPDGVRGIDATVWNVTPTVACQVTEHLLARAEYRHDEASKAIFGKDDRFQNGSDTVALEMIYAF